MGACALEGLERVCICMGGLVVWVVCVSWCDYAFMCVHWVGSGVCGVCQFEGVWVVGVWVWRMF